MSSDPPVGYGRRHLGVTLRHAYDTFMVEVFDRLAERGFDDMRPAHAQVFQNLKEEGVRLTDLARAAGIAPQSMGALVDDLEGLGYIERVRDPHDRRAALIRPTDRGRAEVKAARKIIAELEAQWARTVGKERYASMVETLDELQGDAPADRRR
jgi:DNA-binding MarR family transcriptional regulator